MNMSLSVTGWAVDPELISDIRFELVHSEMTGDCFQIKIGFKNGTEAQLEIDIKEDTGEGVYDQLTEAIGMRRIEETKDA